MSNIKSSYERVKTTLSDILYREKGYATVVAEKMDQFTEDGKEKLTELLRRQNEAVNGLFVKADELDYAMKSLFSIGEEIYAVTTNSIMVPSSEIVQDVTPVPEIAVVDSNAAGQLEMAGVEITSDENKVEEVATENQVVLEMPGVSSVEANATEVESAVVETPVEAATEAAPAVVETPAVEATTEAAPAVVETPVVEAATEAAPAVVETPVVEAVTEAAPAVVETPAVEASATEAAPATEAPLNETVSVAGSTNGLEEDVPQAETTEEIVPFALSPIDEGVTPAAEVVVSQETAPTEVVASTDIIPAAIEPEDSNIIKFSRKSTDPVKAILVTSTQKTKLIGSRETQKALVSNKLNVAVQTNDTKKQMEEMLNQANALYQQGKTDEAQALYNQVSTMNQTIQTESPNVLVKAA